MLFNWCIPLKMELDSWECSRWLVGCCFGGTMAIVQMLFVVMLTTLQMELLACQLRHECLAGWSFVGVCC